MALRDDALACVGSGETAQCVRLTGQGQDGAYLARLVADEGESLWIRWEQPPRGACLPGAPGVLANLGLELRLPADAVLPVTAGPVARSLDGNLRAELVPGQPLWPDADGAPAVVHLGQVQLQLSGEPLPTVRQQALATSRVAGAATDTSMPAEVQAGELAAAALGAVTTAAPDARVAGTWDPDGSTLTVQTPCASLQLPWTAEQLHRPTYGGIEGGIVGSVADSLAVETPIRLPSGTAVGRTAGTVLLMSSTGEVVAVAVAGSRLDGDRCFTVRTTADLAVPAEEKRLFLCASTAPALAPAPRSRGPSRPLPPRR